MNFVDPDGMFSLGMNFSSESQSWGEQVIISGYDKNRKFNVTAKLKDGTIQKSVMTGSQFENLVEKMKQNIQQSNANANSSQNKPGGLTQGDLQDVTQKFNKQLRHTQKFFTEKGNLLDAVDFPYPGMSKAAKLSFFKDQVGTNKPFDIKQPGMGFSADEIGAKALYNGKEYNFDDFGNINYGVAARAFGLTLVEALAGAGYNQTFQTQTPDWNNPVGFFDHSRDTQMIIQGFNMSVPTK